MKHVRPTPQVSKTQTRRDHDAMDRLQSVIAGQPLLRGARPPTIGFCTIPFTGTAMEGAKGES